MQNLELYIKTVCLLLTVSSIISWLTAKNLKDVVTPIPAEISKVAHLICLSVFVVIAGQAPYISNLDTLCFLGGLMYAQVYLFEIFPHKHCLPVALPLTSISVAVTSLSWLYLFVSGYDHIS